MKRLAANNAKAEDSDVDDEEEEEDTGPDPEEVLQRFDEIKRFFQKFGRLGVSVRQ